MKAISNTILVVVLGLITWYAVAQAQFGVVLNHSEAEATTSQPQRAPGVIAKRIPNPRTAPAITDPFIQLCQGYDSCGCQGNVRWIVSIQMDVRRR